MDVGVFGINFKTAQFALHESFARKALSLLAANPSLPWVLLSTCNRAEIYCSASVVDKLYAYFPMCAGIYTLTGQDCFVHLCKVTAGLDSAVLLETDITRQVKVAYAQSCQRTSLPSALHTLFQKALKVAKSTKNLSVKTARGITLLNTLWQIAEAELGHLETQKVLLVGHSKTHQSFARFLEHRGVSDLTFCSRYPEQIVGYAAKDPRELQNWGQYDWISCASGSDQFLIQGKGKKRHLIFDLSVPRNVDPSVEGENVKLWNMEQINQYVQSQTQGRCEEVNVMERHILECARRVCQEKRELHSEGNATHSV